VIRQSQLNAPDDKFLQNLKRVSELTRKDWWKNREDNHDNKIGFYQRQFAKGNGRAFVGYSESLYYILFEKQNACVPEEPCVDVDKIAVTGWPMSDEGNTTLGWVDGLSINKKLSGQKLNDAITFVNFVVSDSAYYLALIPDGGGDAPRYLLPAYKQYYSDPRIVHNAKLYPAFLKLISNMTPLTGTHLCPNLRSIGGKLITELNKL
jgi:thiamine pyridinylase